MTGITTGIIFGGPITGITIITAVGELLRLTGKTRRRSRFGGVVVW